jgi:hypothetical protein
MPVHAGLAKLRADWPSGLPVVGPWLEASATAVAASYAEIPLHPVGAPLLVWRRT